MGEDRSPLPPTAPPAALSAGHAPGPWVYSLDQFDDWGTIRSADGLMVARLSVGRYSTDALNGHRRAKTDPTAADARLIAAAPELLAALKHFVTSADYEWEIPSSADEGWIVDVLGHDLGGSYLNARDAISKATTPDDERWAAANPNQIPPTGKG